MTDALPSAALTERAAHVKALALASGFDLVGIARSEPPSYLSSFAEWCARGCAGDMAYLSGQVPRRSDLRVAFPWARSVICVALQYDTPLPYSTVAPATRGWISRYAWGDDYHDVLGARLDLLRARLVSELGPCEARSYVDSGPIVERAFAFAAGVGFWGKNTCLIHEQHGSWVFLGELVTDLELAPDEPVPGRCGTCHACLDACPTGALTAPYVLDARRCLSYLTIEQRGSLPALYRRPLGRNVFGCDICQDVCPWNRRRRQRGPSAFEPRPGLYAPELADLAALDGSAFRERFRGTAVTRAKRRGLLRNVAVALGNIGGRAGEVALARLAEDSEPLVAEQARAVQDDGR